MDTPSATIYLASFGNLPQVLLTGQPGAATATAATTTQGYSTPSAAAAAASAQCTTIQMNAPSSNEDQLQHHLNNLSYPLESLTQFGAGISLSANRHLQDSTGKSTNLNSTHKSAVSHGAFFGGIGSNSPSEYQNENYYRMQNNNNNNNNNSAGQSAFSQPSILQQQHLVPQPSLFSPFNTINALNNPTNNNNNNNNTTIQQNVDTILETNKSEQLYQNRIPLSSAQKQPPQEPKKKLQLSLQIPQGNRMNEQMTQNILNTAGRIMEGPSTQSEIAVSAARGPLSSHNPAYSSYFPNQYTNMNMNQFTPIQPATAMPMQAIVTGPQSSHLTYGQLSQPQWEQNYFFNTQTNFQTIPEQYMLLTPGNTSYSKHQTFFYPNPSAAAAVEQVPASSPYQPHSSMDPAKLYHQQLQSQHQQQLQQHQHFQQQHQMPHHLSQQQNYSNQIHQQQQNQQNQQQAIQQLQQQLPMTKQEHFAPPINGQQQQNHVEKQIDSQPKETPPSHLAPQSGMQKPQQKKRPMNLTLDVSVKDNNPQFFSGIGIVPSFEHGSTSDPSKKNLAFPQNAYPLDSLGRLTHSSINNAVTPTQMNDMQSNPQLSMYPEEEKDTNIISMLQKNKNSSQQQSLQNQNNFLDAANMNLILEFYQKANAEKKQQLFEFIQNNNEQDKDDQIKQKSQKIIEYIITASTKRIGTLTLQQRIEKIQKYREKRNRRANTSLVKYEKQQVAVSKKPRDKNGKFLRQLDDEVRLKKKIKKKSTTVVYSS